jgi:hypothetical protein
MSLRHINKFYRKQFNFTENIQGHRKISSIPEEACVWQIHSPLHELELRSKKYGVRILTWMCGMNIHVTILTRQTHIGCEK